MTASQSPWANPNVIRRTRDGWLTVGYLVEGFDVRVRVAVVRGTHEIVELQICSQKQLGAPDALTAITSDRLRRLPLRQLKEAWLTENASPLEVAARPRPRGPQPLSDEHFREVARVYQEHVGGAPLKAIMATWGVKRAAASKYVAMARARGFLGWPERIGVGGISAQESPFEKRTSR